MKTIYSIQLLRGIAALLVVLTHSLHEYGLPRYGAVGVDIFFVISGFVIYYVTMSSADGFLIKRIIRIVPLYWLGTLFITSVMIAFPDIFRSSSFDTKHLVYSLFFIPLHTESFGWAPLLRLGWTLNYEMFFYTLFYLAMKVSYKFRAEIASIFIIGVVVAGALTSPSLSEKLSFYSNTMILEFIFGMYLAKLYIYASVNRLEWFEAFPVRLSAIAVFLLFVPLTINGSEYGVRALYWGIPSLILVGAFLVFEPWFSCAGVMRKISVFMGDISYSAYIGHIYVIAVLSRVFHLEFGATYLALVFSVVIMISYMAYRYFERPTAKYLRGLYFTKPVLVRP